MSYGLLKKDYGLKILNGLWIIKEQLWIKRIKRVMDY